MEKRPVYNGYEEAYLTGAEIKEKFKDEYLGTDRHHATYLAIKIPQYLDMYGRVDDHKTYRVFFNDAFCMIMRVDTDSKVDFFAHGTIDSITLNSDYFDRDYENYKLTTVCPMCKKQMRLKSGKYGFFVGCSGYPSCRFAYNIPVIGRA